MPAVAEFIARVAANVRVFKSNIVTQLANNKNTASKQTAALVIAAYRDANPGAVVPDVLSETPSSRSLRAANALATALAQKKFPPRYSPCITFEHNVPQYVIKFALDLRLHPSEHAVVCYVLPH